MDMLNRGGYFRGYSGICVVDRGYQEHQGVEMDILNISRYDIWGYVGLIKDMKNIKG